MTRETKIGLLTGLGVIILIGVLLSQYLGGPEGSPRSASLSSLGDSYRQRQLQPVGVDPAVKPAGPMLAGVDGNTPAAAPAIDPMLSQLPTRDGIAGAGMAAPQVASNPNTQPLMGQPVSPQPAGPVLGGPGGDTTSMPPVQLGPAVANGGLERAIYVAGDPNQSIVAGPTPGAAANEVPSGTFYTVAKGDSLSSIAKHFYKSASKANFSKIVAANPAVLKNEKTGLVVGKKLLIPDAPKPVAAAIPTMPNIAPMQPAGSSPDMLVLRPDLGGPAPPAAGNVPTPRVTPVVAKAPPAVKTASVYKVQSGDTLAKIAKKCLGSSSNQTIRKIMTANKLKDDYLEVGMSLKIPAKVAA